MGLDMYVSLVPKALEASINSEVDFIIDSGTDDVPIEELYYWRKHNALHGWMEALYRTKGGEAESFNCVNVMLTKADIKELAKATKSNTLPRTSGFFFGEDSRSIYEEYYKDADIQFIKLAKAALKDGRKIYYRSWW